MAVMGTPTSQRRAHLVMDDGWTGTIGSGTITDIDEQAGAITIVKTALPGAITFDSAFDSAEPEPLKDSERVRLMRGEAIADEYTIEERFTIEWEDLLDLYRVAHKAGTHASRSAELLAREAWRMLARRMKIYKLGPIADLMRLTDPKEIVHALAPDGIIDAYNAKAEAHTVEEFDSMLRQHRARFAKPDGFLVGYTVPTLTAE